MQVLHVATQAMQQMQPEQQAAKQEQQNTPDEKSPHYVGAVEKVLRLGEGFFYAIAKLAGGFAIVSTAAVELTGEKGNSEACPLNGKAGTFTSITLISGSISALALGISGFCTTVADSSAVQRLNRFEQKKLTTDTASSVLLRTMRFRKVPQQATAVIDTADTVQRKNISDKIIPDAIVINDSSLSITPLPAESPVEQIEPLDQVHLELPALCERIFHATERVFAAIAKMTGTLSLLGFSVTQLQQKRLQACSMEYLIEPINTASTVLGSLSAIAFGLSTTLSTFGGYLKTNRVNQAVDTQSTDLEQPSKTPNETFSK